MLLSRMLASGVTATLLATAPATAQIEEVDSARLMAALSVLAHDSMQGRAPGTTGSERARAFLEREMEASGATAVGGSYGHAFAVPAGGGERRGVNVVGFVPGTNPAGGLIVLTAHFDHLGVREREIFNGADDNASGTVAALEIARRLAAEPLEHGVVVALLDQEEQGSLGARAFLRDEVVLPERIVLNVNLDMVSRTDGELWAAGTYHTPSLRPVLERVADRAPVSLRFGHDRPGASEDDWTFASDHSAFHEAGLPFVYFGVEDHEDYHRPTDDFERVDPADFTAAVRTILAALRALDAWLPPGPPATR